MITQYDHVQYDLGFASLHALKREATRRTRKYGTPWELWIHKDDIKWMNMCLDKRCARVRTGWWIIETGTSSFLELENYEHVYTGKRL